MSTITVTTFKWVPPMGLVRDLRVRWALEEAGLRRTLRHSDLVAKNSALRAYQHRCEARPAFQKALKDHMESFAANAPA